jgi:hypothetical protein
MHVALSPPCSLLLLFLEGGTQLQRVTGAPPPPAHCSPPSHCRPHPFSECSAVGLRVLVPDLPPPQVLVTPLALVHPCSLAAGKAHALGSRHDLCHLSHEALCSHTVGTTTVEDKDSMCVLPGSI